MNNKWTIFALACLAIAFFLATLYYKIPDKLIEKELTNPIIEVSSDNTTVYIADNTCIEYPYTIKNVSGDNITGYSLWVETPPLNFFLEKGMPYSFYVNTKDIEKAIEEYEANKIK